jgi:hypothetical protein
MKSAISSGGMGIGCVGMWDAGLEFKFVSGELDGI